MIFESFAPSVELGLFALRRSVNRRPGWSTSPPGLAHELREYLHRPGAEAQVQHLLGTSGFGLGTRELIERVQEAVENGEVEIAWRSLSASTVRMTVPELPEESAAAELSMRSTPSEEPSVPDAPETEATRAQIQALQKAAEEGTPFCEVCERAAQQAAANTDPAADEAAAASVAEEAAQVQALTDAAANGTAFCEVCAAAAG